MYGKTFINLLANARATPTAWHGTPFKTFFYKFLFNLHFKMPPIEVVSKKHQKTPLFHSTSIGPILEPISIKKKTPPQFIINLYFLTSMTIIFLLRQAHLPHKSLYICAQSSPSTCSFFVLL